MFKEANKIFLIISFLIIFILIWFLLRELCSQLNTSDDLDDNAWLKEIGVEVVDQNIWPHGLPAKKEWADILRDCLVKSDDLSLARCQSILEKIQSYNDCVIAGFAVMESYPEQCQTSDGRLFINE
jgi:hypothetical protein